MSKSKLALLATLLCLGATAPAFADWDNIGSVDVSGRGDRGRDYGDRDRGRDRGMDRDSKSFHLGGPVERLQLTADRGDVYCRSVRANFGNGRAAEIFHGDLRAGRPANIDLPGDARTLSDLDFVCTAQDRRGATIRITADVGHYRDTWRRNPDFDRTWSRMFNWGSNAINNWQMIGSASFEGRDDSESSYAGWNGRRTDAIALKPLESDARCSRVTARFERSRSQDLNVNNGDVLRRGQFYKLDLPGNMRNLKSLDMNCHAMGARRVTLQIFTSRN